MERSQIPFPKPKHGLIGHRGIAGLAPENTIEGLELAANLDLNWIEVDAQILKSGNFVIFHDQDLERITKTPGLVFNQSLAELSKLNASAYFTPAFQPSLIPSLEDLIQAALKLDLSLNLEIKAEHPEQLDCASIFYQVLTRIWPKERPLPLISSFHWEILDKLRTLNTELWLGYLSDEWNNNMENLLFKDHTFLHCDKDGISPEQLAKLPRERAPISIFTVNEPLLALAYLEAGAYAVFSDLPLQKAK
jgi:glycerophosphoryl diester phosphodiesterase